MDNLIQLLTVAFANNFVFYLKTHDDHWNVQGTDFPQYHSFLETIYSTAQSNIDDYAEQLRRLGAYAGGNMTAIQENTQLTDPDDVETDPVAIFTEILADTETIVATLQEAFDASTSVREYGLQNFLADRIDEHRKQQWMIRAILARNP